MNMTRLQLLLQQRQINFLNRISCNYGGFLILSNLFNPIFFFSLFNKRAIVIHFLKKLMKPLINFPGLTGKTSQVPLKDKGSYA
jgi:hypothetical protein